MSDQDPIQTTQDKQSPDTPWGAIALVSVVFFGGLILGLPTLDLAVAKLTEQEKAWVEWGKFAIELLVVLFLGGAVFSETVGRSVKQVCARAEESLDAEHAVFVEIAKKFRLGEKLSKDEWSTIIKRIIPTFKISTNFIKDRDLRLMVWLSSKGMTGGLFGLVAFILFLAKTTVDVVLLKAVIVL